MSNQVSREVIEKIIINHPYAIEQKNGCLLDEEDTEVLGPSIKIGSEFDGIPMSLSLRPYCSVRLEFVDDSGDIVYTVSPSKYECGSDSRYLKEKLEYKLDIRKNKLIVAIVISKQYDNGSVKKSLMFLSEPMTGKEINEKRSNAINNIKKQLVDSNMSLFGNILGGVKN